MMGQTLSVDGVDIGNLVQLDCFEVDMGRERTSSFR